MKVFRFICYFLFISLLLIITVITIRFRHVLFPKYYFPYQSQSGILHLYSDAKLEPSQIEQYQEAANFLNNHPLHQREDDYDIFLCTRQENYTRIATKINMGKMTQGLHMEPIDYSLINLSFIESVHKNSRDAYANTILAGNTTHILLHEITHGLLTDLIGWWSIRKIPNWKLEGYCEFAAVSSVPEISTDNHYKLLMENYLSGEMDQITPGRMIYIRASLITWFCMEIEGMSIESFLSDSRSEALLFKQSQDYWTETISGQ